MPLVSISGPPVTGKTTLWNRLREDLGPQVVFVPDLPRQALEILGPRSLESDLVGFQHFVGYAQLVAEEAQRSDVLTLCDKSLIDALAYWDVLVEGGGTPAWAVRGAQPRYALAIICQHERGMRASNEIQRLHAALGPKLAARIANIADERAARTVIVAGGRRERARAAHRALVDAGLIRAAEAAVGS